MAGSPLALFAGHMACGGEAADPREPAFAMASTFAETAVRSIQVLFVSHQPQLVAEAHDLHDLNVAHAAPPHFPVLYTKSFGSKICG